jgi:hypothetical protein
LLTAGLTAVATPGAGALARRLEDGQALDFGEFLVQAPPGNPGGS